jgi:16S rRNA (uracil1498-N3)-methyltransferase
VLTGDQFDEVVRDATMLGVTRIVPMATDHVTVPKRARGPQSLDRWRRIAIASVKQCGRAVVPDIAPVASFAEVLGGSPARKVMCVEPAIAGALAIAAAGSKAPAVTLLIGPEGGWSSGEVAEAARAGATLVHLGPRTLRAERAPVVALSALWTLWGW